MRYMLLVYSKEGPDGLSPDKSERIRAGHGMVISEATRKGVLVAAEPLAPTSTATTVRLEDDAIMVTDGPFAETKEQLAGYYVIECQNLDQAIEWASKIPTACQGMDGCIEIRPMRFQPARAEPEPPAESAAFSDG